MPRGVYVYLHVSTRRAVQVVTAEDALQATAGIAGRLAFVQRHSGAAADVSGDGIRTDRALTAAVGIVCDVAAGEVDHGALLDLTHLAAAIDGAADGAAIHVHLSPDTGGKLRRVVLACGSTNT